MDANRKLVLSPYVRTREFDGELVLLDLAGGEYYALDGVGARLWVALAAGCSFDEAARDVAVQYSVRHEVVLADVVNFADELVRRGLMKDLPPQKIGTPSRSDGQQDQDGVSSRE